MRSIITILLYSTVAVCLSCGSKPAVSPAQVEANAANAARTPTSPPPLPPYELTSEAVLAAFKNAGLPVTDVVVYTEETDTNHLLGRPHQYVGKINFTDSSIKNDASTKQNNSIEVFLSQEDLEARKNYAETISNSRSMFVQYIFTRKNALLRLNHAILPKNAARYEAVLRSL